MIFIQFVSDSYSMFHQFSDPLKPRKSAWRLHENTIFTCSTLFFRWRFSTPQMTPKWPPKGPQKDPKIHNFCVLLPSWAAPGASWNDFGRFQSAPRPLWKLFEIITSLQNQHFDVLRRSWDPPGSPRVPQEHPKSPKWPQQDPKMMLKCSQNDPKMAPKCSPNDSKILPKLCQINTKMMPN